MWIMTITVNALLGLVGCAIASYIGNGIRAGKLKRFFQATFIASLLSWVFYSFPYPHEGTKLIILPAVLILVKLLRFYLESKNNSGAESLSISLIPFISFLTIFSCFWWFSRWRSGEIDYFRQ